MVQDPWDPGPGSRGSAGPCVRHHHRHRCPEAQEEGLRDIQERLQLAQQVTRIGTFDWNITENTNHWSPEILALYGLTPAEFEGTYEAWLKRLHPDDAPGADEEIRRSLETGQFDKDFRVVWPDGSLRWLHSRARVLYDDNGRPARMVGINADVTDRHQAEERLREAEERAGFVRKASGVGFWYCDLPFDVLEWDELVKAHFHLPPDAHVTIDTFYARIHPDDREPTRAAIARSIAERSGYDVHYRTVHPTTGEEKWVRAIGRTFYGDDVTPRRFDGVTLDVTDRRRAEEMLRDSEQRFREMADTAPVALWLTDPEGSCTFLSREWYEFTGQSESEALGLGWTTATHPDDQEAAGRTFLAANAARTMFRTEYRLRTRDGSYRWAMDIGRSRFSPDGDYLGMVGAVFDLEDRKQAEDALRDADQKKDDFIALLAHELRNPLAPIRNGLQIVRQAQDPAGASGPRR